MRVDFDNYTSISEVVKLKTGLKPYYGKGTMKGVVRCQCNCCVADLLFFKNTRRVVGFLDTECTNCHKQIDYSDAEKYI